MEELVKSVQLKNNDKQLENFRMLCRDVPSQNPHEVQ